MIYRIIEYLSTHLYTLICITVAISLVIFFIVGSIKSKRQEKLLKESYNESKIDAPYTKRKFVEGMKIEKQEFNDLGD